MIVIIASATATWNPGDTPMRDLLGIAGLAQVFALVLGIVALTAEFRHGTITPSLLIVPDRVRLTLAKLGASLATGLALGLAATGLTAAIGAAILNARGIDTGLTGSQLTKMIVGGTVATGLYAALGVGVGAIVRNQVGAVVGTLVYLFVLENLLQIIKAPQGPAGQVRLRRRRPGADGHRRRGCRPPAARPGVGGARARGLLRDLPARRHRHDETARHHRMISHEQADRFATEWIGAWNAHDLDAIVAHYAEDVTFVSPFVAALTGEESGRIEGRDALREYFRPRPRGLPRPALRALHGAARRVVDRAALPLGRRPAGDRDDGARRRRARVARGRALLPPQET